MAGITALGTTYNLPNYTGELINITPVETPLLSAVGGLNGGGQVTDTEIEWQTKDIRPPAQNVALEGADAPTPNARVRANVTNVVEIHHSKVAVTYTKQAATGRLSGLATASGVNPVQDELGEQIANELAAMAQDIDFTFLHGKYQKPSDNTTARKTRGLIAAITTNVVTKATLSGTSATAATDTITSNGHGLSNGDVIVISDPGTSALLAPWAKYTVSAVTTNTFKVAPVGGSVLTLGTVTGIAWRKPQTAALDTTTINSFIETVYLNGGMRGATRTLIVGSTQKLAISAAYTALGAKASPVRERIGGVVVDVIDTDFGPLNVMLHPRAPRDAIIAASLDELRPVFLEVPGKGHMFVEPLAKVGAKDEVQIYGEVGLAYGAESHHGILTGLAV